MRIVKRIVASALLVLVMLLLAATGAYLLVNDATFVPLLRDYLESVSGTRITFDKDAAITRTLSPTLRVKNLVVEDENKDFYAHVSSLQFQVSLPSLFSGKFEVPLFILGDTRIEIKQSDSSETLSIPESLPLIPVFHDIQVSKLAINHGGEDIVLSATHLSELSVSLDPETDTFVFLVDIDLAGNTVHINATLPRIHQTLKTQQLPFTASAKSFDIDLSTEGNIDFKSSPPRVQVSASLRAPDLKRVSTGIKDFVVPGALTGKAEIAGTFDQLAVKDISATWKGPEQSGATINGAIDNVMQLSGCELKVDGHLEESAWLSPVLPDSMGTLQSADLTAQVSCTDTQLRIRNFSLQAKTTDTLDLSLAGQLNLAHHGNDGVSPENIDLKLKFSAPTTRTARLLFFENIWELGAVTGTANIRSSDGDPAIEDISVITRDSKGIEVDLTGKIARFPLDPDRPNTGYDLDVTMKSDQTSVMAARFDLNLPLAGPLEVKYRIEGDSQALQLNAIDFTAGEEQGIQVAAAGSLHFGNWDLDDPLENIDLTIKATTNDTQALEALLGENMPDLGPLAAQALVHTVSGKHRIDNFRVQTGEKTALQASVAGSAENIAFFGQSGIQGVQLKVEVIADDTAQFNSVFGLQDVVPAIGPFKARGDITGSHERLTLSNFVATAGKEDTLLIDVQGKPGIFSAASDWSPKETDLSISAQSTSSSSFFDLLGFHLPELGPIAAHATIKEKEKKLMLESANIAVGDSINPVLIANGHIYDLFAFKEIDMEVKLNLDGHSFAALSDSVTLPDLQPLIGEIIISDSDGTLGIDTLHAESIDEKLLSFEVTGLFDDFKNPDTLSLTTHLRAKDLLLIGALFDQQWPAVGPVQLDSKIQKKGTSLEFDTSFAAGEMRIQSSISSLFHSSPPQINGTITAQNFFLPRKTGGKSKDDKDKQPTKKHVFSRDPINFNWLKYADVELSIEVESFDDVWAKAESAHFQIIGKSGKLTVSPATLTYPQGELNLEIDLDVKEIPKVRFEAHGKDLNPWLALDMKESSASKEFDAEVDVDIHVTSSGISQHELASNMQGEVYVNLKNGKMRRSLLDLIFLDFVGWTYARVKRDKYVDVNCGVADFTIKDGIIDTKALFIDSKTISIAGQGTIDLANEQIDYVFLPKKKSKLIKKADPVNIKGPLNNPSIQAIPWKTAATTYGSLFFAPYLFVGIWAADFLSDTVKIRAEKSPCQEYERKYDQEHEADVH